MCTPSASFPTITNPVAPALNGPAEKSLVDKVVDHRINSLACVVSAQFHGLGPAADAIINQNLEVLKAPYKERFSQWSESDLQKYHEWQLSPIVAKIENAIENALYAGMSSEMPKPNQILNSEELQTFDNFEKSAIGQMKTGIETQIKPQSMEVMETIAKTIEKEILDPLTY